MVVYTFLVVEGVCTAYREAKGSGEVENWKGLMDVMDSLLEHSKRKEGH